MSWEVRTMRSATSYFNFTLLRKNFARFWPIWSLYGLFWLAVLPLNILSNRIHWDGGMARSLPLNYLDGGPSAAVTLTALFGLLCAMAVFSYLYASRSVGMLHALPLRREGLFLTNYLSGLLFLLLPNLAVFLLALAAEVFAGTVVFSSLFTWLVVVSLFGLFFLSGSDIVAALGALQLINRGFAGFALVGPAFGGDEQQHTRSYQQQPRKNQHRQQNALDGFGHCPHAGVRDRRHRSRAEGGIRRGFGRGRGSCGRGSGHRESDLNFIAFKGQGAFQRVLGSHGKAELARHGQRRIA